MEVSNTSFVSYANGNIINLWGFVATLSPYQKFKRVKPTWFYFESEADAEIYREYLLELHGKAKVERELKKKSNSKEELEQWQELLDSIDFEATKEKASHVNAMTYEDAVEFNKRYPSRTRSI